MRHWEVENARSGAVLGIFAGATALDALEAAAAAAAPADTDGDEDELTVVEVTLVWP